MTADAKFAKLPPSISEWTVIAYLSAIFLQEFMQFKHGDNIYHRRDYEEDKLDHEVENQSATVESQKSKDQNLGFTLKIKWLGYCQSHWNIFDFVLLIYFLVLMSFRVILYCTPIRGSGTDHYTDSVWILSFYNLYFLLWCIRFFQIFSVSQLLGPKLIMIKLMLGDLIQILAYIVLASFAYSVLIKALLRQTSGSFNQNASHMVPDAAIDHLNSINANQTNIISFFDDLLNKPLWHLFGESLSADFEEDKFPFNEKDPHFTYKLAIVKFWGPMLRFVYMLITVILLLNLMIAIFNKSIQEVTDQAKKLWNVYRKSVIIEYHAKPILPIPLSILQVFPGLVVSKSLKKLRKFFGKTDNAQFKCTVLSIKAETEESSKWIQFTSEWEKNMQNKIILEH